MARPRDHAGADDLPALLDFASRSLTARFPVDAGWRPGDLAGVRFRRDLDSEIEPPGLPRGMRLRHGVGIDPDACAA